MGKTCWVDENLKKGHREDQREDRTGDGGQMAEGLNPEEDECGLLARHEAVRRVLSGRLTGCVKLSTYPSLWGFM